MSYGCSTTGDTSGFRGCGREFGSLETFDRHWTKVTSEDDPTRDRPTVDIGGRRCATDAELTHRGIVRFPDGKWRDRARVESMRAAFRSEEATESDAEASPCVPGAQAHEAECCATLPISPTRHRWSFGEAPGAR